MQAKRETILIPMLSGDKVAADVLTFRCAGHDLSVRKINDRLCYVLHRATGLKVTAEYTGDPMEAAEGFKDAHAVGAYDLSQIAAAAASFPAINAA
jgi:hypothetical protein